MSTNIWTKLTDIKPLQQLNVRIKNPENVEKIINEFRTGGFSKLQIVSDYDYTLSKKTLANGDKGLSSFCLLEQCKSLPSGYKEKSEAIMAIYKPIELDPTIPIPDKVEKMVEWWTQSSELLRGAKFDINEIDEQTAKLKDSLKDGSYELFKNMETKNVPILVFSAGLGNCVVSVLKQEKMMLPNVKVVSNFLHFEDGVLTGLDLNNLIHVFNKNETALQGTDYFDMVKSRDHILLMGDSLGDANMAVGMPVSTHVLKIGYLFDSIELNLPLYMDAFDIVIINDETMNIATSILNLIE